VDTATTNTINMRSSDIITRSKVTEPIWESEDLLPYKNFKLSKNSKLLPMSIAKTKVYMLSHMCLKPEKGADTISCKVFGER
jgi:hypothetical protein